MLRLTKTHRTRVPNSLAIVAAAVLITAAAIGMGNPASLLSDKAGFAGTQTAATGQDVPASTAKSNRLTKKFKVSLMLLPRR